MQNTYRFALVFSLVAGVLLFSSGEKSTATVDRTAGYAFPAMVGAVLDNPRTILTEQLAIVERAGVPTSGDAVRGVVGRAQGERFNYFDPAARDDRGMQIWGQNGAPIPADSMSMLRNKLQAAMVVDYAATLDPKQAAALGLSRFSGVTIAAIENFDRASAAKGDPRWELASDFAALEIAPRVFAVDEAALAAGLRLTLKDSADSGASEGIRNLGLAILIGLLAVGVINALEPRRRQSLMETATRFANA